MENSNESLLTLQAAAEFLGVKAITLRKWDRENKLKSLRIGDRNDRRYKKSDLVEFLEKSQNKIEWIECIRSGASWHIIPQFIDSLFYGLEKIFKHKLTNLMLYFEADTIYWYYDRKDLSNLGKIIVNALIDTDEFSADFFKNWNALAQKLLNFISNNDLDRIKKLGENDLAKKYKIFDKSLKELSSHSIIIDATDEYLMSAVTEKIKKVLKKFYKNDYQEKIFIEVYNILTLPEKLSYLNNERVMILLLVKKIKENLIKENSAEFEKAAQEIIDQFWWTGLSWARGKAKTISNISREIKEIIENKVNIEQELEKIDNYQKETKIKQDELEKKYSFSKELELQKLLDIYYKLVEYHDFRKEVQMKSNFWHYQFIDYISEKTNIPANLLDWCDEDELISVILKKQLNETELIKRSANFLYLNLGGKEAVYTGKVAQKKHEETLGLNIEQTRDLQGADASPGKAIGEAFVAISSDLAKKIKPGQILITGMTTPDFTPAMRKAAGVVTDEGGITCHAAIVSRELGVPCIVGTKYATRLIKTGDIVEVAANHGVVRILK